MARRLVLDAAASQPVLPPIPGNVVAFHERFLPFGLSAAWRALLSVLWGIAAPASEIAEQIFDMPVRRGAPVLGVGQQVAALRQRLERLLLGAVLLRRAPQLLRLQPHQRARLTLFLDPSQDPLGGGYHLLQSTVGIGSGGLLGTGLMHGHLTLLRFIPEQHTDFIFSALGEETGFIGSMVVVLGFVVWIWRLLQIAGKARTDYESLVVVGIGAMVMFQVVVNINMTIGLGPITGIPLPWLSYGRSAMLVNFIALGLCASVARRGVSAQGSR
jgi:cell division protein FtsW (lipid II flippase)